MRQSRQLLLCRETTQERHSRQAWEVELGKGLTAEPWATESSVSSAVVPRERDWSM